MLVVRALAGSLLLGVVASSAAQTVKLNGPLAQPPQGFITGLLFGPGATHFTYYVENGFPNSLHGAPFDGSTSAVLLNLPGQLVARSRDLSPDGSRIAYLCNSALYCVPTDGSTPAVQVAPFIPIEDDDNFQVFFAPDSQWIVYRESESFATLFSVPADGSQAPIVLHAPHGYVGLPYITADGTRVVYLFDDYDPFVGPALYSVPIDGSASEIQLSASTPASQGVNQFLALSPDGARAVYISDQATDDVFELYSVAVDGSASPVKISGPLASGGDVMEDRFACTESRAVYLADGDVDGRVELYSAPLDGSAPAVKISGPMPASGDVTEFEIAPDGRHVVYLADAGTDEAFELYLAPVAGGSPAAKLNGALVSGGDVLEFRFSPDGRRLVYRADQDHDDVFELYSVALGKLRRSGSPRSARLNAPLAGAADVLSGFELTADGRRVVFNVREGGALGTQGFVVSIDGGAATSLNPPLGPLGPSGGFRPVSGNRVVFYAAVSTECDAESALYGEPLDASAPPVRLSAPLPLAGVSGDVQGFQLSPDGSQTVYVADQESAQRFELYRVPTDASAAPSRLSAPLICAGQVGGDYSSVPPGSFAIGADGARVVYIADQDKDNVIELFSVPLDGSSAPVRLNDAFGSAGKVYPGFRFSPGSERIVYRAYTSSAGIIELFSAPATGSASPVRLNGTMPSSADVQDFTLSSDGAFVVYRSDEEVDEKFQLYSAPIDGSALRVRLNQNLASSRDVVSFQIEPTSRRVLFTADANTDEAFELYAVPIGGGTAPTRLNDPLVAGRSVLAARVSDDGERVVYVADELADEQYDLFSVPIDRSSAPLELDGTPVSGGDVSSTHFEIDPRGRRVVYVADQDVDGRDELYSVPLDGSAAPTRLNGALAPGGRVGNDSFAFAFTPDGRRVVYVADETVSGSQELRIVPADGSASSRLLGTALGSDSVESAILDRAGFQAIYMTRSYSSFDQRKLFRVPLDGSSGAEQLTSAGVAPGFVLTPDEKRVLYRSDEESGALDLFAHGLPRLNRPAGTPTTTVDVVH